MQRKFMTMNFDTLTAVSPIDGRYHKATEAFSQYFSEYALIQYRVKVEIEYFIFLCEIPLPQLASLDKDLFAKLRSIYQSFSEDDAREVKEIEKTTNHDVKAVEYFIKRKFDEIGGLDEYKEFIHFGLTSQDINNTAFPMMIRDAVNNVFMPELQNLVDALNAYAAEWKDVPMLAHTHGQPASPTRLGKEIRVFSYRIEEQMMQLKTVKISGKFGGATGNFNAHHVAYPEIDWKSEANEFLSTRLGIEREQYTTQISNYDNLAALLDNLRRINTIIIDLDRDFWTYISMGYFKQKIKEGEVGSSAMPHKVNPIDYENSEGNLGLANAIYAHLSLKLPVSRMQRDLTDSTVIRNLGVPLAHSVIAIKSTLKGLGKLLIDKERINADLENNWEVLAEAIQTVLRREKFPHPYETLKQLTRTNKHVGKEEIEAFIDGLNVRDAVKAELKALTPQNYTGI